ncbi:MAG: hypothetical protein PHX70_14385 [Clostridium sp.]|nr:hypothetical protein [Clostridium sp.]
MEKSKAIKINEEVTSMLKTIEEKYGVSLKTSGRTYDNESVNMKITFVETSNGESVEEKEFNENCELLGLSKSDYNKVVTIFNGKSYKIVGIKPRAKYNVILEDIITHQKVCYIASALKKFMEV